MALTVNSAFLAFLRDTVNLDPDETRTARNSRDWLKQQINALPNRHLDFPLLVDEFHIDYGSFARRTKIRKLNDIEVMIGLHPQGSKHLYYDDRVEVTVNTYSSRLPALCHDGTDQLNSKKVLNMFKSGLKDVPQYNKADIKYTQQAAVLNLTSYDWSFDIVPCFMTSENMWGKTYYLIPDGNGHWMKTDPRIDKSLTTLVNQQHNGNVLNVLRLIKFWTKRPVTTTIPSYLLETIILKYYDGRTTMACKWPDEEIPNILSHIANTIIWDVQDPKQIQGNINKLDFQDRNRISALATRHATEAKQAQQFKNEGEHKQSIEIWRKIFGLSFPAFN